MTNDHQFSLSFDKRTIRRTTSDKMTIDLYYSPGSSPVRSVRLAAAAVGVPLNLKLVDLVDGDQLKPEFLRMNIRHSVPTMDDMGFYLSESRAIMGYFVDMYAKDDKLYPKEPKARAMVDQMLYFDMGTMYMRLADYYYPVIFEGASFDPAGLPKIFEAFEYLDSFLDGQEYVAGKWMTIADLAMVATVSTYDVLGYDFSQFKNVVSWYNSMKKTAPQYHEINEKGAMMFGEMAAPFLKH